jgi:hypothetical protein
MEVPTAYAGSNPASRLLLTVSISKEKKMRPFITFLIIVALTVSCGLGENKYGYKQSDLKVGQIWVYHKPHNPFKAKENHVYYKILELAKNQDSRLYVKYVDLKTSKIHSTSALWFLIGTDLKGNT